MDTERVRVRQEVTIGANAFHVNFLAQERLFIWQNRTIGCPSILDHRLLSSSRDSRFSRCFLTFGSHLVPVGASQTGIGDVSQHPRVRTSKREAATRFPLFIRYPFSHSPVIEHLHYRSLVTFNTKPKSQDGRHHEHLRHRQGCQGPQGTLV